MKSRRRNRNEEIRRREATGGRGVAAGEEEGENRERVGENKSEREL